MKTVMLSRAADWCQAWKKRRRDDATNAAALVAALALCAQGADRGARDRPLRQHRYRAHRGGGRDAERRTDEGEPAEPAADAAARGRDGDLRLGGDLRVFRLAACGRQAVSGEVPRAPRRAAPPRA